MEEEGYRLITLGQWSVGKTTILLRARNPGGPLRQTYQSTLGVDFMTKDHIINGRRSRLLIWDTAGQERFMHLNRIYYRDCQGIILIFDVASMQSFLQIDIFANDFYEQEHRRVAMVLVGNKIDLKKREVSKEMGEDKARKMRIPYLECSAITGEGIDSIFDTLCRILNQTTEPLKPSSILPKFTTTKKKKKRCC